MSGSRKKKMKSRLPYIVAAILAVALLTAGIVSEIRESRMASTEMADLNAIFEGKTGLAVVKNYDLSFEDILCTEDRIYVSAQYLREQLNSRFYCDEEEYLLLYTLPGQILKADADTLYEGVSVLEKRDGKMYIYLPYAAAQTNMTWTLEKDPLRLVIKTDFGKQQQATVKESSAIREAASLKSPIMKQLAPGDSVILLEKKEDWSEVCTEDGIGGYMRTEELGTIVYRTYANQWTEPVFQSVSTGKSISMVWDLISVPEDNNHLEEYMACTVGVNVVAPTWFRISDSEGNFESLASADWVEEAHAMGKDVWILVNNMDNRIYAEDLTKLLNRSRSRRTLVQNLVSETIAVGADGINVDIEQLPSDAGLGYIQMIRELSVACHQAGLVLSVDDYVPSNWTKHYYRAEQGIMADYVIVMAYDEHYSGSDAGSTASLGFVKNGIEQTLTEIPAEKLIAGVPFYSRLWKGYGDGMTSTVLSMNAIKEYVENYQLKPVWDDEYGQSYAEFTLGGVTARLWLEDTESMNTRLNALSGYHLAGVAGWRLGMESEDVWDTISQYYGDKQ